MTATSLIFRDEAGCVEGRMQIMRYPVAAAKNWLISLDGGETATIAEESIVFHSEEAVLAYIAARQPTWRPCARCTDPMDCGSWRSCCSQPRPGIEIDPKEADIRIEVDARGVYLGFFTKDGRSAVIDLDAISRGESNGSLGSSILQAWVADRRKQAIAEPA